MSSLEYPAERAAHHAAYIIKYTGYIGYGDLLSATKRYGLLMSTRYTEGFFILQKARQLLSRPPLYTYSRQRCNDRRRLASGHAAALRAGCHGLS